MCAPPKVPQAMHPVPQKKWEIVVPEPKLPAQLAIGTSAIALGIAIDMLYLKYIIPVFPTSLFVIDFEGQNMKWGSVLIVFLSVAILSARAMFALRETWWKRKHPDGIGQLPHNR